jgi:hypothetical protein
MTGISLRITIYEYQGLLLCCLKLNPLNWFWLTYQLNLMPAMKDAQAVWQRAEVLARTAKLLNVPVWATEQNPPAWVKPVLKLGSIAQSVLAKMAFSAVEEGLGEWLSPPTLAVPKGNARSLPRHLQKPAEPESGSLCCDRWL